MDGSSAAGGPNWLGLLQWSLAHSDGTSDTKAEHMSEEDKEWLANVLKESVKNEADRLKEIYADIMKIVDDKALATDRTEAILDEMEELRDIVEQIDMAQIFAKFGGVVCLSHLFSIDSLPLEIKTLAASTIGTLAQNNPAVQQIMLEQNSVSLLVTKFMECLNAPNPVLKLAEKLTYAISCSIRNHLPAERAFIDAHGAAFLHAALLTQHVPLVTRVFFLTQALLSSDGASLRDVQLLCGEVMPVLLPYFALPAAEPDVQLREVAAQLLLAVLHTDMGWAEFGVGRPCHADFRASMQTLREQATEDVDHTGRLVAEIVAASQVRSILHPRPAAAAVAAAAATTTFSSTSTSTTTTTASGAAAPVAADSSAGPEPVLRIAPPELDASSSIP